MDIRPGQTYHFTLAERDGSTFVLTARVVRLDDRGGSIKVRVASTHDAGGATGASSHFQYVRPQDVLAVETVR